jgi:hypothetical protein
MKSNRIVVGLWFLGLIALTGSAIKFSQAQGAKTASSLAEATDVKPPVSQPVVIWFHSVSTNPIESLELALSSGLVSDVLMLYMHRNDADFKSDKAQQAIKMVKDSKARLIWCRDLWPYYKIKDVKAKDIYNPSYYLEEIKHLRAEADEMGADAVALDIEPYGDSPMKLVLKDKKGRSGVKLNSLNQAISDVIKKTGQVDYILPGGSTTDNHPYNVLCLLGENRISESTYYNQPARLRRIRYPFEIFGAYVNVQNYNPQYPLLPFYRIPEIFEYSQIWSNRKGVFLYTDGKSSVATAKVLNDYVNMVVRNRKRSQ